MKLYLSLFFLILLSCKPSENQEISIADKVLDPGNPPQWTFYPAQGVSQNKHIVLISGDEEYRSEEALPQLAKILSTHHGYDCTVLFAQDPEYPGIIDPNYSFNIPGLEQLEIADLMVIFTRFRDLPSDQMKHFDNYLLKGKPVLGIRTATHAFNFKDKSHSYIHYGWKYNGDNTDWKLGFGKIILGESWYTHHGWHKHQSTRGILAEGASNHPITNGIAEGALWGSTDVYGIREPIGDNAQHIYLGQSVDREGDYNEENLLYGMSESDTAVAHSSKPDSDPAYNPNEVMPPIVWTKNYKLENGAPGQSVTTTIGAAVDMLDEDVRRLLVNATLYLLEEKVPSKAKVDLVGDFKPTAFQFHKDEYWDEKQLKVPASVF